VPWTESDAMDQRLQFVTDPLSDRFMMTELVRATASVVASAANGWAGSTKTVSADWRTGSRRPHMCPTQIRPVLAELLCEFRRLHPDWGARKLLHALRHRHFEIECHGLLSTETATARPIVERVFREYGLPAAIRTDNACRSRPWRSTGCRT